MTGRAVMTGRSRALTPLSAPLPPPVEELSDPSGLPDFYLTAVKGDCMASLVGDGAIVLVSRGGRARAGDLALLFRRPEFVEPGLLPVMLKLLVTSVPPSAKFPYVPKGEFEDCVCVRMLNPSGVYSYPCSQLLGIHRVVWTAPRRTKLREGKWIGREDLPDAVLAVLRSPAVRK